MSVTSKIADNVSMFPDNIIEIILKVIKSWQVIAITLAILLYISIVNYVTKSYHKPRAVKKVKQPKSKPAKPAAEPESADNALPGGDSNDELGLEEA